jgi:trans-aconitate methyltransferase
VNDEPEFLSRTRASYDTIAADYTEWVVDELAVKPLDRAVLDGFAELVRTADRGPVADIGCGPGRLTAYLHRRGVAVSGIDLSPQMIALARRMYPDLHFDVGSMTALRLPANSLGGILAWYSVIHVPDEQLPDVFAQFHRLLVPGGYLQLAFQAGDEVSHRTDAAGHTVALDFHRRRPENVAALLQRAGLPVYARTLREPDAQGAFPEPTPQAFLLARKPLDPM